MPLQWHPFLAQFLRQDYGDQLIIQEEVNLGDMPLRVDLLLIRRDASIELPYPFNFLGGQTLVEYKGPGEIANQADLVQLETYGLLYQQKEKLWNRQELTLWLLASQFSGNVSQPTGAYLSEEQIAIPSVRHGLLDGFPTCLIDLSQLPISEATLPLVMVSKGSQEKPLAEFLIDHHSTYSNYLLHFAHLHLSTLREVLSMRQMAWEEIGVEAKELIEFFGGPEKMLQIIGEWEESRIDPKELIEFFGGPEKMIIDLAQMVGKQQLLEILAQLPDQDNEASENHN